MMSQEAKNRRERIATAMLAALVAKEWSLPPADRPAVAAVWWADALIAELDKASAEPSTTGQRRSP